MARSGRTRGTGGGTSAPHGGGGAAAGGGLSGVFAEVAGGLREGTSSIISSIQGIVGQMQQFVAALSPSTVQMFGQAVKDLHATIGQAFQPAFAALAGVVRQIADQISPLMQELAPVIRQVTEFLGQRFVAGLHAAMGVFEAIVPVVQTLFDALSPLSEATQSVTIALAGLIAAAVTPLAGLLQAVRPVIDAVVNAVKDFARGLILATAYLLKFAGMTDALGKMIDAFTPKEGGRVLAAGPTQITGLEEVVKQLATSAAQARGGAAGETEKTGDQWLATIAGDVAKVRDSGPSLQKYLEDLPGKIADALAKALGGGGAHQGAAPGVGIPESGKSVSGGGSGVNFHDTAMSVIFPPGSLGLLRKLL